MPVPASLLILALSSAQTPAASAAPSPTPAGAAPAIRARIDAAVATLDLAVREIQRCCEGRVETAPIEAQRRWASALNRWLILSGCKPDLARLARRSELEAQARRLDGGWAATIAVHPSAWLEAHRGSLGPPTAGDQPLERFLESFCALAVFELDRRRAIDRRDAAVREADRELAEREKEILADAAWARDRLAEARSRGRPFDYVAAFSRQREALAAQIAEREDRIKAIQDEDAEFQVQWREKHGKLSWGTLEFQRAIGEYRRVVNRHNDQIVALGQEITKLQKRIDRLTSGAFPEDADDFDLPPAAAPVGSGPAEPAAAATPAPIEKP